MVLHPVRAYRPLILLAAWGADPAALRLNGAHIAIAFGSSLARRSLWRRAARYGGWHTMGLHEADTSVVIAARPQDCFDVLIDCIGMPEWQVGLRACEVLSRDEQGRPKDVAFEVDAIVKTMKYTLRHSYEEPYRITGEYLDGDFEDFVGEWLMKETASGETKVTFTVGIDPGTWVPGQIARTLNQKILRESVERLKTEVEQRLQGAERQSDPPPA